MARRQVDKINFERGEQTVLKVTLVTKKYILSFNVPVTNSASQSEENKQFCPHITHLLYMHLTLRLDNRQHMLIICFS